MDIGKFDVKAAAEKGADLHLHDPWTNEPLFCADGKTPFVVRVMGRDARAVRDATKDANAQRVKGEITDDEAGIAMLSAAIVGWSDELELDGKPFPYSKENAVRLIADERMEWMVEQITPFVLRRKNFSQNMRGN